MERTDAALRTLTRRHFFGQLGFGIGAAALASLLERDGPATAEAGPAPGRPPHFAPKARSVIFLFMAGGPSQLDLFEPKPTLARLDGQAVPDSLVKGERFAFIRGTPRLLASPYAFRAHGRSGARVSALLPHLAQVVDELAFVRSLHTEQFNHAPAQIFMNSGHPLIGRPSMGAWLTYGLGSENSDLPGFVVMVSGRPDPGAGSACWSSGFLPTGYQGVEFRSRGEAVPALTDPPGLGRASRRRGLDLLGALNERRHRAVGDPEIEARIAAYEMAFRMQASVPELVDLGREPRAVHQLYGSEPGTPSFASNCLLARRLVERGVRFVQLYHRGWDHHGEGRATDLTTGLPELCRETDRPVAALVQDLRRRGLLDSTLVIWGGEFGRTPMNEERNGSKFPGRDHHPRAFTMWLAGGGIKPGTSVGATDDLGYHVVEDPVHVHDLHATALHVLGIDHTRLTYRFQGRDHRLTDVHGKVVAKLLA